MKKIPLALSVAAALLVVACTKKETTPAQPAVSGTVNSMASKITGATRICTTARLTA